MEPIELPEIQRPLAMPLYLSKYEVTMYTVGGNDRPAPVPTSIP